MNPKKNRPVIVDGRNVDTRSSEYKQLYPNLVREENGELSRTLDEVVITPSKNTNLGSVIRGGHKTLGEDYIIPALKTAASFNPSMALPMISTEFAMSDNKKELLPELLLEALPTMGKAASVIKGLTKIKKPTNILNDLVPGYIGWAPAETRTWRHASNAPIEKFRWPDHNNWAVAQGGTPEAIYLAKNKPTMNSFLSKRKHQAEFDVKLKKPMVQVGDIPTSNGKNNTRRLLHDFAIKNNADAYIMNGIKDNQMTDDILVKFHNSNITKKKSTVKHEGGGTISGTEDLGNPAYSKKKPLSIKQQEDLFINDGLQTSNNYFKKSANLVKSVAKLHPTVGAIIGVGELLNAYYSNPNVNFRENEEFKREYLQSTSEIGGEMFYGIDKISGDGTRLTPGLNGPVRMPTRASYMHPVIRKNLGKIVGTPFKAINVVQDLKDIHESIKEF